VKAGRRFTKLMDPQNREECNNYLGETKKTSTDINKDNPYE
jgi:hypothetical protein